MFVACGSCLYMQAHHRGGGHMQGQEEGRTSNFLRCGTWWTCMSASGQPVAFTIVLSSSEYSTTLDTALLLPGLVPTRHAAQHCVKWLCGAKAAAASSLAVMLDNP